MKPIILDDIPFEPDLEALKRRLRLQPESTFAADLARLAGAAQAIARPRALCRVGYIEERGDDSVVVDGVRLDSRVLAVNLANAHRVFVYAATCGVELDDWANTIDDMLPRFWADAIMDMALRTALGALQRTLDDRYRPGQTSTMNPGSLEDWPISQQRALFTLLGDPQAAIGVQLLDTCLMLPIKTVSGVRFPTEESFASCQLCPREVCPGRRAPYDPTLYDQKYR